MDMEQREEWEKLHKSGKLKWIEPDTSVINLTPLFEKRKFKRILDLGCGSGRHIVYLAKRFFFVVGSDISANALAQAQEWLEQENVYNYCLVENDMVKLPFPDKHFDAVISMNVIDHNTLPKIKKTVKEIRRVLKTGGLVIVTLPSIKDYKFGIGKRLEKNSYLSDEGIVHHFFDEKSIKSLFEGFKIMELKEDMKIKEKKDLVHSSIVNRLEGETVKTIHWQVLAEKL